MVLSEYMQLNEIAETADIGGDSLQFHEEAIRDFQAYMNEMDAWCRNIAKEVESRIKEAEKEG